MLRSAASGLRGMPRGDGRHVERPVRHQRSLHVDRQAHALEAVPQRHLRSGVVRDARPAGSGRTRRSTVLRHRDPRVSITLDHRRARMALPEARMQAALKAEQRRGAQSIGTMKSMLSLTTFDPELVLIRRRIRSLPRRGRSRSHPRTSAHAPSDHPSGGFQRHRMSNTKKKRRAARAAECAAPTVCPACRATFVLADHPTCPWRWYKRRA